MKFIDLEQGFSLVCQKIKEKFEELQGIISNNEQVVASALTNINSQTESLDSRLDTVEDNIDSLATVATSGSYNDLSNKPTNVSSFTNDAGYLTQHQSLSNYVDKTSNLNITGVKTFVGVDKLVLQGGDATQKPGFAIKDSAGTKVGFLELRGADKIMILGINNSAATGNNQYQIGLREFNDGNYTYHVLLPKGINKYNTLGSGHLIFPLAVNGIKANNGGNIELPIPSKLSDLTDDVGYLTEHQSLSNYYSKLEIDNKLDDILGIDVTGLQEIKAVLDDDDKTSGLIDLIGSKVNTTDLATVATTGSYNDLINKPSGNAKLFHGTCATEGATVSKVVECSVFTSADLVKGALIFVTFTNTNSGAVASLTMNVNGTGAKSIKKHYSASVANLTAVGELRANETYLFSYDGTYWVCITLDVNTNTTYTNWSLGQGRVRSTEEANVVARTCPASSYGLTIGGIVNVIFNNDVPASATLNINGKGAKPIMHRESSEHALVPIEAGDIKGGDSVTMMYNGSSYVVLANDRWGREIQELKLYINDIGDYIVNGCPITNNNSHVTLDKSNADYGKPISVLANTEDWYKITNAEITMGNTIVPFNDPSFQISKVTDSINTNFTTELYPIHIPKIKVKAGKTKDLKIYSNFELNQCAILWGFLDLPEGVSITGSAINDNDRGEALYYKSPNGFMMYIHQSGIYVLSGLYYIGSLSLTFDNSVTSGSYNIDWISGVGNAYVNSSDGGLNYSASNTNAANTKVTIYPNVKIDILSADDFEVLLTESDTSIPEEDSGVDIKMIKQIKANTWTPICLPFNLSVAEAEEIFGSDYLYASGSISFEGTATSGLLTFFPDSSHTYINANELGIIKVSSDINEIIVRNKEFTPDEDEAIILYDNGRPPEHPRYERYGIFRTQYTTGTPKYLNSSNGQMFMFDSDGNILPIDDTTIVPAYCGIFQDETGLFTENTTLTLEIYE